RPSGMQLLIGDVFRRAAATVADRRAAAFGEASITFGELDRRGNQTARALGLAPGDRVLLWTATTLELLPVFVALAKVGAVLAPMNPALSVDEAVETAAAARPAVVLSDAGRADAAGLVAAKAGAEHRVLDDVARHAVGQNDGDVDATGLSEGDPHVIF